MFLRKLVLLTLTFTAPMALGVACDDKDDNGDDGNSDDGNDDGNNDDGNNDDGNSDDGNSDDGNSDDGNSDDGHEDDGNNDDGNDDGQAECEQPSDCPVIHCNCDSGVVNYTNCDNGHCGTESDCPAVCEDFDQSDEESDGGDSNDDGSGESGDTW